MNVRQLISQLQEFDPDMEVKFSYNYGDHWKTHVAETIYSVEEARVSFSSYHDMDAIVDEDEDKDDARVMVVIS